MKSVKHIFQKTEVVFSSYLWLTFLEENHKPSVNTSSLPHFCLLSNKPISRQISQKVGKVLLRQADKLLNLTLKSVRLGKK